MQLIKQIWTQLVGKVRPTIISWSAQLKNHYSIVLVVCCSIFIYVHVTDSHVMVKDLEKDTLFMSNQAYLTDIERRATANYVHLTMINNTLSTMKSSVVGISFFIETKLTIGEEIKHLEELTGQAAYYSGVIVMINIALKKVLFFAANLSPVLFMLSLISALIYSVFGLIRFQNGIKYAISIGRFLLTLFIIAHLLLPYSVHLAGATTQTLEQDRKLENSSYFKNIRHEFNTAHKQANTKERAKSILGKVESVLVDIERKIENLFTHAIEYAVSEIIETLLIPLLLFSGLYVLMRRLINLYLIHPAELNFNH